MKIPLLIAFRYLFAKKSNNIINWISAISVAGIAVGSAALILILSIYNGFDAMIRSNVGATDFPYLLVQADRKFFEPQVHGQNILEDKVFVSFGQRQTIAVAKGMDGATGVSVSEGLAHTLGYRTQFYEPLHLMYPDPGARISVLNPTESMTGITVHAESVFPDESDSPCPSIILPMDEMRRLTGRRTEVSAIGLEDAMEMEGFRCLDSVAQHDSLYRMIKSEKAAIFLILICVVVIVSFNILTCNGMMRIEKKNDCVSLRAMGLTDRDITRIFTLEGMLISASGLVIGLCAGLLLAGLQMKTGLIQIPGQGPYPVAVRFADVSFCAVGTFAAGTLISLISSRS